MQTVKQFVNSRFNPEVVKYMKHAGKKHYDYILEKHVLPAVGERRLRDITSDDIQALVGLKHDSGCHPKPFITSRMPLALCSVMQRPKKLTSGICQRKV